MRQCKLVRQNAGPNSLLAFFYNHSSNKVSLLNFCIMGSFKARQIGIAVKSLNQASMAWNIK